MVLFDFVFFISIIVIFFAQNPQDASTLPVEVEIHWQFSYGLVYPVWPSVLTGMSSEISTQLLEIIFSCLIPIPYKHLLIPNFRKNNRFCNTTVEDDFTALEVKDCFPRRTCSRVIYLFLLSLKLTNIH